MSRHSPAHSTYPEEQSLGEHLALLAGIGQDFAASLDIEQTLNRALARIADHLGAEAASLFLFEEDARELTCRACFGPVSVVGLKLPAGEGVVGRSVQEDTCLLVRDVRRDPDFARGVDESPGFTTRSILCAPMRAKDRLVGAVELVNKRRGDGLFSEQDRHLLQALASSAALAITNARLTAALIEQERLRRELELAAEIQRSLLPRRNRAGMPVCGVNLPARGVSGDFFDVFEDAHGRYFFNVGDVSGKGIEAALLMAKTCSLLHCLGKSVHAPGRLLGHINAELCEAGTRGMFVTMVCGIYDPGGGGTITFANAGHEPPLHHARDGTFRAYRAEAPPLGIAPDVVPEEGYPESRLALEGGSFYVFTDGVTEGRLAGGGALGVGGFKSLVERYRDLGAMERLSAVVDSLQRPGTVLHDDVTLLVVERSQAG